LPGGWLALLEQAASHGEASGEIVLRGLIAERSYQLEVESNAAALDPATLGQLFQPALIPVDPPQPDRLDLGLYLAREIARGHGGSLVARLERGRQRFILTLPTALD